MKIQGEVLSLHSKAVKTPSCIAVCRCCFLEAQRAFAKLECAVALFTSVTAFGRQSDKEKKEQQTVS